MSLVIERQPGACIERPWVDYSPFLVLVHRNVFLQKIEDGGTGSFVHFNGGLIIESFRTQGFFFA
jgi:hypothetical protein